MRATRALPVSQGILEGTGLPANDLARAVVTLLINLVSVSALPLLVSLSLSLI